MMSTFLESCFKGKKASLLRNSRWMWNWGKMIDLICNRSFRNIVSLKADATKGNKKHHVSVVDLSWGLDSGLECPAQKKH